MKDRIVIRGEISDIILSLGIRHHIKKDKKHRIEASQCLEKDVIIHGYQFEDLVDAVTSLFKQHYKDMEPDEEEMIRLAIRRIVFTFGQLTSNYPDKECLSCSNDVFISRLQFFDFVNELTNFFISYSYIYEGYKLRSDNESSEVEAGF